MHRFWDSIIKPIFEVTHPHTIVEIGSGAGTCTRKILTYCDATGALLHAVDPLPTAWRGPHAQLTFHNDISLNVLSLIPHFDAVLIDGDHNWYTVYSELLLVERKAKEQGHFPLVFLHDTGWPYGRRDLYYVPERIPSHYRKAYMQGGLLPGCGLPTPDGINASGHWHAIEENPLTNGVLTAIEDFLAQSSAHFHFANVPGMHGLGILAEQSLLTRFPDLESFLTSLTPGTPLSSHLASLEADRLHHLRSEEQIKRGIVEHVKMVERLREERRGVEEALREGEQNLAREREERRGVEEALREGEQNLAREREERRGVEEALREKERNTMRILQSRSYRWTALFRHTEQILRSLPCCALFALKDIWSDLGTPCPSAVRFIRHTLLGRLLPVRTFPQPPPSLPSTIPAPVPVTPQSSTIPSSFAVIVLCTPSHHAIAPTIKGLLTQTQKPSDILIVDDSGSNDVHPTALAYAGRGVEYLHGTWRNLCAARNAGMQNTNAPLLVFLVAGDLLPPDHLRACALALSADPAAAIAYADGLPYPFDALRLEQENTIPHAAMVRRESLEAIGEWPEGLRRDANWITWRRILVNGWKAVKVSGERCHPEPVEGRHRVSMVRQAHHDTRLDATLCLSLSGRAWMWPLTADFLARQAYPHDRTHLVIVDTSQEQSFGETVRAWLDRCDYGQRTYIPLAAGLKGLADLPRRVVKREVAEACAKIYNIFVPYCTTKWVFLLEDDIIPPLDAYPALLRYFDDGVASVSALCMQRGSPHPIAWEWDDEWMPAKIPSHREGVTSVGGNGFCCVAVRGEFLRDMIFRSGSGDFCHDHNFYKDVVREHGLKALLDWSCICRHYLDPHEWK